MHFTSETSSNGVIERTFTLDEITGVLWSPTSGTIGAPLLLSGHSGGMHKKAPGLVAGALQAVSTYGFTVAAIDAPGHGDRPRNRQDRRWAEAIHQARVAGEPIAPFVIDYNMSLAARAVPEWQATLDALQGLPEVGVEAPIGYGGVTLGVATGLMLTAVESRINAVSFGGVFVCDALIEAAGQLTIPIEYRIPWDDEDLDRSGIELNFYGDKQFDPVASAHGCLVLTDDVDYLYAVFTEGLKAAFGSVPTQGVPRVGVLKDMSYGMRQFLMTDPGGNTIQIAQPISEDQRHRPLPQGTFDRAIHMGSLFADAKQDLGLAVKVLDRALHRTDEEPTAVQLVKLLVLRADVAVRQGQLALARELLARAGAAGVSGPELADDLRRAAELEAGLRARDHRQV